MSKTLEVGYNYGPICGIEEDKGSIVYLGGISFRLTRPGKEMIQDSQKTYDNIYAYINQPVIAMGMDTIGR
jgi:hypothetical protein